MIVRLLSGACGSVWHYYPASFAALPCCCWREKRSRCVGRADGRDRLFEGEWEIQIFARGPEEADALFTAVDGRLTAARLTRAESGEGFDKSLRVHTVKAVYRCVYDARNRIYQ